MPEPTEDMLKKVSNEFYQMWNFPNCCGAIDGKHIRVVCPEILDPCTLTINHIFQLFYWL